ncbi:MAG: hypothetical protein MI923_24025 [Phycisphaerales bacterium]|nr:hypothetical protein [Phycisphaerales bacterium]
MKQTIVPRWRRRSSPSTSDERDHLILSRIFRADCDRPDQSPDREGGVGLRFRRALPFGPPPLPYGRGSDRIDCATSF